MNGAAQISDIKDGTSNTFAMIETPFKKTYTAYGPWVHAYTYALGVIPSSRGINSSANPANPLVPYWQGAGSLHDGGCHALMCDGAVRFIGQNISNTTLLSLQSIRGGEVVGEF
jgi:prepilin-type processing-associated H-X9-DG protein